MRFADTYARVWREATDLGFNGMQARMRASQAMMDAILDEPTSPYTIWRLEWDKRLQIRAKTRIALQGGATGCNVVELP